MLEYLVFGYDCPTGNDLFALLAGQCPRLKVLSLDMEINFATFATMPSSAMFENLQILTMRRFDLSPELSTPARLEWQVRKVGDILKVKTPRLRRINQTSETNQLQRIFLRQVTPNKLDRDFENFACRAAPPNIVAQRDLLRLAPWAPCIGPPE